MDEKITIIEGPPPVFEEIGEGWVQGLNESPSLANMAITRLRTFTGAALVERCHRAWRSQTGIPLEFRASDGLIQQVPIIAARNIPTNDGDMLLLWVRLADDQEQVDIEFDDDSDQDPDDPQL